ncbi:Gfo/Idh/MocA family protein [Microbacterium sp. JZ31]|uniref:Gfo/Idh/MocA family protein n=1 Tax=Microbacterium sp. JZ31 TaxID=1906274 RepID=UPI001EE48698|nr:Gfo/Idh/MocA family oxidoreductase [Microbacterium sp. JZ31]
MNAVAAPGGAPTRVVQVGAGGMGRAWLRTIAAEPDAELVGLVDLDLDVARTALADGGIDGVVVGQSVAEVAAATGADAVIDVTVPAAHLTVNTEALAIGLPVLCEKPAAPTVADALRQAAAAEVHGRLLMISQSRRYYAALDALRAEVAGLGAVGTVVTEFYKAPRFGGFREEMDHVLLVDMAIHAFDAARSMLGSEPVSVYCEEHNPSWSWYRGAANAHAIFTFSDGERFVYTGSWCAPGLETSWNGSWRISAERGSVAWDGAGRVSVETAAGLREREIAAAPKEEIAASLAEFLACLRSGGEPSGAARRNVHSLAMVEAAVMSAETGRSVRLDEVFETALARAVDTEPDASVRAVLQSWAALGGVPHSTPHPTR